MNQTTPSQRTIFPNPEGIVIPDQDRGDIQGRINQLDNVIELLENRISDCQRSKWGPEASQLFIDSIVEKSAAECDRAFVRAVHKYHGSLRDVSNIYSCYFTKNILDVDIAGIDLPKYDLVDKASTYHLENSWKHVEGYGRRFDLQNDDDFKAISPKILEGIERASRSKRSMRLIGEFSTLVEEATKLLKNGTSTKDPGDQGPPLTWGSIMEDETHIKVTDADWTLEERIPKLKRKVRLLDMQIASMTKNTYGNESHHDNLTKMIEKLAQVKDELTFDQAILAEGGNASDVKGGYLFGLSYPADGQSSQPPTHSALWVRVAEIPSRDTAASMKHTAGAVERLSRFSQALTNLQIQRA